jgi:Cd2+/Zn2+-exporting ATPase
MSAHVSAKLTFGPSPAHSRSKVLSIRDTLSRHYPLVLSGICLALLLVGWLAQPVLGQWSWAFFVVSAAAGGSRAAVGMYTSLREGKVEVDLLMLASAAGSFSLLHPEEGCVLLFLFSLSSALEGYALARTRAAIEALKALVPAEALVKRGDTFVSIAAAELLAGDIVRVLPGGYFPTDGVVSEGTTTIDTSSVTGEAEPVDLKPGDSVLSGTINLTAAVDVRVSKPTANSLVARIIDLVEKAREEKTSYTKLENIVGEKYTVFVLAASALVFAIPQTIGWGAAADNAYRAVTFLVVASPCALVISVPAAVLSTLAACARAKILVKSGNMLKELARADTIAFDKTGTLTRGAPALRAVATDGKWSDGEALAAAAALGGFSTHPTSAALVRSAKERGLPIPEAADVCEEHGAGVAGVLNGSPTLLGRREFVEKHGARLAEELSSGLPEGTARVFLRSGERSAVFALEDEIRPEAAAAVMALRNLGIREIVMLSGDGPVAAASAAAAAGVTEWLARLLPHEKLEWIAERRREGRTVIMVGDGINDAPALAKASIGVAMGGLGSEAALESADVVLAHDDLRALPELLQMARRTRRIILQNVAFALSVMGVLALSTFLIRVPLPLAVVGHEGSTVLVILNGLRLLRRPQVH